MWFEKVAHTQYALQNKIAATIFLSSDILIRQRAMLTLVAGRSLSPLLQMLAVTSETTS
jgi:hypothetical protein